MRVIVAKPLRKVIQLRSQTAPGQAEYRVPLNCLKMDPNLTDWKGHQLYLVRQLLQFQNGRLGSTK